MDANEYQRLAMTTANPDGRGKLPNSALGLAGEAGEFADNVKKVFFQGHEMDIDVAIKELGDIAWYLAHACDALEVALGDVMEANLTKLGLRYPKGFEVKKSVEREEYKNEKE